MSTRIKVATTRMNVGASISTVILTTVSPPFSEAALCTQIPGLRLGRGPFYLDVRATRFWRGFRPRGPPPPPQPPFIERCSVEARVTAATSHTIELTGTKAIPFRTRATPFFNNG